MKANNSINVQSVEVTVERVMPFGVFVRLPNGTEGYIRRRELDLDADIEPANIVQKGQKIQAVVIKANEIQGRIELSRRSTLKDPWPEFARRYHEGEIIRGTIRALHPNGVFVRVQAGINGFVPLNEIATWQVKKPEDVLWVGDTVETDIVYLDLESKRLTLSIKSRMAHRDNTKHNEYIPSPSELQFIPPNQQKILAPVASEISELVGTILVIDDHNDVRTSLTAWLNRRGFTALEAESLEAALTQVQANNCQVLLVDLNLVEKDGLELIRHLRNNGNEACICVMSDLDSLTERANEIEIVRVAQVFPKPLNMDDIEAFLTSLVHGEPLTSWRAESRPASLPDIIEVSRHHTASLQKSLLTTLEQVTQLLRAEVGLVFWLDTTSRSINILAKSGDLPIQEDAIYSLSASPVRDVMRDGEPVLENHVTDNARARFDKLLELFPFESCIGVPVQVNDEIKYTAFFFHRKSGQFSSQRLHEAQTGSLLFAAIIMREMFEKQFQSLNPMLLSGELARGFGHDVFNKITALDLEASFLTSQHTSIEMQTTAQHLLELILDLKTTVQAFQQLLQRKETHESFDVNRAVDSAINLLRPIAHKERAKIEINLANNLPLVKGNNIMLQQVFLNLMLNAVQQMSLKADHFQWNGQRILKVTTSLNDKARQIRIRFIDNGPGIHQSNLMKIFSPGFSTREGSGLGLYIAQGFVHSLGGTLRVRETLVPLGTIFLVEVPYITEEAI